METKSTPLWRKNVVFLGLLAALFTAIFKAMDNITVHNFIVAEDGLTAVFAYLIVGGWTGFVMGVVFSLLFGKRLIDQDFNGLVWRNAEMHRQAVISGGISAGSTLFLLWGNQFGDPSALTALSTAVIAYTAVYDLRVGQVKLGQIALPVLLAVVGSSMAAFSGSFAVTMTGIFFVLVISNGLAALAEVSEQKGARASDGVNFFIWRFWWLAISGTMIAFGVSHLRGYSTMLNETLVIAVAYLPFIALTMSFVFLGIGFKLTLKKTQAVSVILLILASQVVLAFPITIFGEWWMPGIFGGLSTSPVVWMVRFVGAALLISGIFLMRKNSRKTAA